MSEWLHGISSLFTPVIGVCAAIHLLFFLVLWIWYHRDLKMIAGTLDDYTRGLPHRSTLGFTGHLTDQIEAFVADVQDVLATPERQDDRQTLLKRIQILDEKRRYLHSLSFESAYHVCRTMIEAYPLMGILGTILAIGSALQTGENGDATLTVSMIVLRFGDAIWSTFAGLVAALVLMFINSLLETRFGRLTENRQHVRELINSVKRELTIQPEEPVEC
ncbi:MAG: MotA/TolQ/ExbB proton channel family protein [Planctomycetota bacterium]|nr:MotA/TolQ/ExbB proton channel family protein [Planctomycetota bacterium]MDA1210875.1 MotA/TolQ/ExbB proton channel family protein [Planctomycetota bacterium]